jgi:TNF receptor-associated protein 1
MFIKEGIAVDSENKDALFKLLRFESRNGKPKEFKSLEDYIGAMQPGQEKIYFLVNPNFDVAIKSPFLEPFRGSKIDVLILSNNVDEILFQQNGDFKGKRFINVESSYDEISKDLGKGVEDEVIARGKIPEEDITPFCLWVKNELSGLIGKVQVSRRLKDTPAIMSGQMSSSMRLMMQMMEQSGQNIQNQNLDHIAQEQTLELNTSHPIIVNLNGLRKKNKVVASLVCRQLLDNVMVASGIPYNV